MEEIVTKCYQLFAIFGVLWTVLLIAIFTGVTVVARNSENTQRPKQPIRMALCVHSPHTNCGVKEWFTVGKVYMVKSGCIVDDQEYKWTFVNKLKCGPHTNTCGGGYEFYII